jgi:hypothetical protein
VLFVHGGGDDAYNWDRKVADRLQTALGSKPHLDVPKFAGLETWIGRRRSGILAMRCALCLQVQSWLLTRSAARPA